MSKHITLEKLRRRAQEYHSKKTEYVNEQNDKLPEYDSERMIPNTNRRKYHNSDL